jgi:hypothetical protein
MVSVPPLRDGRRTWPSAAGRARARFDIGVVSAGSATPLEVGLHGLSLSQPLVGPGDDAIAACAIRNSACGQPSRGLASRRAVCQSWHVDLAPRLASPRKQSGNRSAAPAYHARDASVLARREPNPPVSRAGLSRGIDLRDDRIRLCTRRLPGECIGDRRVASTVARRGNALVMTRPTGRSRCANSKRWTLPLGFVSVGIHQRTLRWSAHGVGCSRHRCLTSQGLANAVDRRALSLSLSCRAACA